jgi:hypothetical protein
MNDNVVEKKTFGGKMKNSFLSIPLGMLFILLGILLLISNEKSAVRNNKIVAELRKEIVNISSDSVDNKNNNRLIATKGKLVYFPESLSDSKFNVSVNTPILKRVVEVYQWEENSEDDDDKTTYTYEKKWSEEIIDSSKFKNSSDHMNPSYKPFESEKYVTESLKVGNFSLDNVYKNQLSANNDYYDLSNVTLPEGYVIEGKYITNCVDMSNPVIGNIRISYKYGDYSDVSILGRQENNNIVSYTSKQGTSVYKMVSGNKTGTEMIDSIEKTNKILKWVKRLIGISLISMGISAILSILTTLLSYIPILGGIANTGISLVAFLLGLAISLVIIAISWFAFRPVLSIILIAAAVLSVITIRTINKKQNKTS